jgi:hypothetical protein
VQRTAVQVDNEIYEGIDELDKRSMYAVNGQKITVAYDPYDRARALAIVDRRVIAELQPKPRIDRAIAGERSAETDIIIADTLRLGRVGYKGATALWNVAQQCVPTLLDGLRERHQLAAPAAPVPPPLSLRSAATPALDTCAAEPEFIDDLADRFAGGN